MLTGHSPRFVAERSPKALGQQKAGIKWPLAIPMALAQQESQGPWPAEGQDDFSLLIQIMSTV